MAVEAHYLSAAQSPGSLISCIPSKLPAYVEEITWVRPQWSAFYCTMSLKTPMSLTEVRKEFGNKIAMIVDGLPNWTVFIMSKAASGEF